MIGIVGKVKRHGRETFEQVEVPANREEARGAGAWGLVIAGGLLLLTATALCLILFGA